MKHALDEREQPKKNGTCHNMHEREREREGSVVIDDRRHQPSSHTLIPLGQQRVHSANIPHGQEKATATTTITPNEATRQDKNNNRRKREQDKEENQP
jgi:hypothetical protein